MVTAAGRDTIHRYNIKTYSTSIHSLYSNNTNVAILLSYNTSKYDTSWTPPTGPICIHCQQSHLNLSPFFTQNDPHPKIFGIPMRKNGNMKDKSTTNRTCFLLLLLLLLLLRQFFLHQPVIGPNACQGSPLVELHHTGHTQRIALTFWIGT